MSFGFYGWAPRKSAAERRADAARHIHNAAKRGKPFSPVAIAGRSITTTYWGDAWCDNLERYKDYAYRLDRGRSYVRSGSVIDLQISAGSATAKVSGSELYDVEIEIDPVEPPAWRAIQRDCAGRIGSRVDLLAGKLSEATMTRLCAERTGLFPHPTAIDFTCTCPDHAVMCKHVAATMYGIGARLDHAPELLFTLRQVSLDDLVSAAISTQPAKRPKAARILADNGLAALFGIELAAPPIAKKAAPAKKVTGKPKAKPPAKRKARKRS